MKLAGAVLIFVFFSLLGIYKGDYEKKRLSECEAFAELFEYIKNQGRFFLTPTKVMYRNFENDLLEKSGFLPELRSHEKDDIYCNVWNVSFEKCMKYFHLTEKQRSLIMDFGDVIGKSNGEIQMQSFDYYISMLKNETEKQRAETEKNIKLYRTLGIAAGACAAILII